MCNKILGSCTGPDSRDILIYFFEIDGEFSLPDCLGFDPASITLRFTNCPVPGSYNGKLICMDDNFFDY